MKWEIAENSSNSKKPKEKLDKRILVIFLIIFTEVLGFSIVLPVLPFLALSLGLNVICYLKI